MDLDDHEKIASVELMKKLRKAGDAICHRLSRIYFAVEDEDIKIECRKAVYSAKKMGDKLGRYKAKERERTRNKKEKA